MPFGLGGVEIGVILVIILLIFGVGRLPEVGGSLGKGLREFRRAVTGDESKPPEETKAEKTEDSKAEAQK